MATRSQINEIFQKDGTYLLLVDFFKHIVDVRSGITTNDKGTEAFCQFIKHGRFNQKKISHPWFFGEPIYETEITGDLGETALSMFRRGIGTGVLTSAPFDLLELIIDSEKVCAFEVDKQGRIHLHAYRRGEWLSVLKGELSALREQKLKQFFEAFRKLDEKIDEDNFRL